MGSSAHSASATTIPLLLDRIARSSSASRSSDCLSAVISDRTETYSSGRPEAPSTGTIVERTQ